MGIVFEVVARCDSEGCRNAAIMSDPVEHLTPIGWRVDVLTSGLRTYCPKHKTS